MTDSGTPHDAGSTTASDPTVDETAQSNGGGAATTLLASGVVLLLGLAIQLGTNFLTRIFVARAFGAADYGAISLGFALLTTLSILVTAGVDTGVGRFLPRFEGRARRQGVLVSAFLVVLPVAVLAGIVTAVGADYLATTVLGDAAVTPVLRVFAVAIPGAALVRLTVGSVRGMEQSLPRVAIQNVAVPVVRLGLVGVVLLIGADIVAVSWAYATAYGVASVLSVYYLVTRTPLFAERDYEPMYRRLLLFSLPLLVTTAMKMVLSNLDTFVLGVFGSTGDVGAYNAAYPLASLLTVGLSAFGFVFMPIVSGLDARERSEEFNRSYRVVSKWVLAITLPLALVAITYPRPVLGATFGLEYERAATALTVLAVGFFTHAITGPSGNALTALGETGSIMWDNVVVAAVNLCLNIALVPQYSLLGAAVATAVSYALLNALYLAQLYRATGAHPFRSETLLPALGAVGLWVTLFGGLPAVTGGRVPLLVTGAFLLTYPVLFAVLGGVEEAELAVLRDVEERTGVNLAPVRRLVRLLGRR